jgi:putative sterol carrier protein
MHSGINWCQYENYSTGALTMSNIAEAFAKIESRFDSTAAAGLDVVFQFSVDDDAHHLVVQDGKCQLVAGEHSDPSVTLIMDGDTFAEVVAGDINGMQAFMTGRLRTEGDMMLATRLSDLFSI